MDHSDSDSTPGETEQPSNWRDQADGFADDEAPTEALAHDEPTRQWATIR